MAGGGGESKQRAAREDERDDGVLENARSNDALRDMGCAVHRVSSSVTGVSVAGNHSSGPLL